MTERKKLFLGWLAVILGTALLSIGIVGTINYITTL